MVWQSTCPSPFVSCSYLRFATTESHDVQAYPFGRFLFPPEPTISEFDRPYFRTHYTEVPLMTARIAGSLDKHQKHKLNLDHCKSNCSWDRWRTSTALTWCWSLFLLRAVCFIGLARFYISIVLCTCSLISHYNIANMQADLPMTV